MIEDLCQDERGIEITVDGRRLTLSWMWLRDHARDADSYLASAEQRLVPPAEVAAVGPGEAELDGLDALSVRWPGGPDTRFDLEWLRAVGDPTSIATTMRDWATPWVGDEVGERIEEIDAADFDDPGGDGLSRALVQLATNGIVVLRNVPIDVASTQRTIERFGYLRSTIFGELWTFRSDGGFDDTASTPMEITPHTDGTYSHDAPGLLVLHCHVYEADGGENVLVDGFALADHLAQHFPEDHDVLRTVEIPGRYIGDGAHLVARRPVLRHESQRGADRLVQVSYNHHDRAPFLLPDDEMRAVYRALHRFDELANADRFQFQLALRPGDMVCVDNWRLLHGRRAFRGDRLIAGGYVNREDLDSALRTAGLAPPPADARAARQD